MKAVKVFVFDGGRSGYIELAEDGKLLPFYCYSEGNVAQSKLDISFKGLSKSNRVFVYLLYDAQTIHTIN